MITDLIGIGGLDDGRGLARVVLFRHKHEIETGRTSSVGMEVCTMHATICCVVDPHVVFRSLALIQRANPYYPFRAALKIQMFSGARSSGVKRYPRVPPRSSRSSVSRTLGIGPTSMHLTSRRPRRTRAISEDHTVRFDLRSSILRDPHGWSKCWDHRHVQGASGNIARVECSRRRLHN